MSRPRLLDLFSGAGGSAVGYHRAGFDVVGVDLAPQPRYPLEFHQADALTFPLEGFDAIHASPPCPGYANVTRWRGRQDDHPRLIAPMRERLIAAGVPWVIENVRTTELRQPTRLCGTALGVRTQRHRYFETGGGWLLPMMVDPCCHRRGDVPFDHGGKYPESTFRDAIGCEWMTVHEARQAIPPAMTQWIGSYLIAHLRGVAA